jgi:hypothetical protein
MGVSERIIQKVPINGETGFFRWLSAVSSACLSVKSVALFTGGSTFKPFTLHRT